MSVWQMRYAVVQRHRKTEAGKDTGWILRCEVAPEAETSLPDLRCGGAESIRNIYEAEKLLWRRRSSFEFSGGDL